LHEEVDRVLGGRLPTLADVPKLVYTRAVFEEVLRLYPPAPLLAREAVRDEEFNGRRIPKGSLIMVCPWLLHRHRQVWHNPDHFIPERFLSGGTRPTSKFAYIPFSVGPRVCTGMAFGLTEAILSIATIAQSFMLRLVPGHRVEVACRLTLRPGERLPMQLVPRRPCADAPADAGAISATQAAASAGASDGRNGCPYHGRSEAAPQ
jgi:cytochrome P450